LRISSPPTQTRGPPPTAPTEEYRPTSDQEWAEFEDHFDKRKVELGGCARPYGTPCSHEHAPLTELTAEFGQLLTLRGESADSLPA
jgi:hypothetical protein